MQRRQSQRGTSSWEFKSDPVLIALPVVYGDLKTQLLRVERFGLRHIGDCHHHHLNSFISHCHNLPFTCRKTACCVSFSLLLSEIIPCLARCLARFKREQGQTETDDL